MSGHRTAREDALDPNRRIGSVCAVFPSRLHINLGDGAARSRTLLYGAPLGTGQVGEFVLIDCDQHIVLGRVNTVRLLERERLAINPSLGEQTAVDPIGEIDLLATLNRVTGKLVPGVENHPRLGSLVYAPAPRFISQLVAHHQEGDAPRVALDLGAASGIPDARVKVTPERMFGRHCAILGATGGGKSFTIAKLVEETSKAKGKAILIDATGEFYTLGSHAEHVSLGQPLHGESEVHLPFSALEEQDLYGLFQPSGKVQGPKLREAIYSLRIAHILNSTTDPSLKAIRDELVSARMLRDGLIVKENGPRAPFESAMSALRHQIEAPNAEFDITLLATQVSNECCYATGRPAGYFGGHEDSGDAWCSPLVARINAVRSGAELRVFFDLTGDSLLDRIDRFLDGSASTLRISLASVPYGFNAREIVANALGRRLLSLARQGRFKTKPLIVFLDEAHNFLNRYIGTDDAMVKLDAFDQIAKEGRKHWLTIALATQRPRDLPEGVLSQMGTMVVHRLINHRDREVVERASGDIDRASVAFLPTLAPGQAAMIGVDFPFPLTVSIDRPATPPDSAGPDYQTHWL